MKEIKIIQMPSRQVVYSNGKWCMEFQNNEKFAQFLERLEELTLLGIVDYNGICQPKQNYIIPRELTFNEAVNKLRK